MRADDPNTLCPHCQKPLGIEAVSKLMSESRFSFTMQPKEGELLSAGTVGGCIEDIAKLMDASAKDFGAKSRTVVEAISSEPDGTIKVDFLITRVAKTG